MGGPYPGHSPISYPQSIISRFPDLPLWRGQADSICLTLVKKIMPAFKQLPPLRQLPATNTTLLTSPYKLA